MKTKDGTKFKAVISHLRRSLKSYRKIFAYSSTLLCHKLNYASDILHVLSRICKAIVVIQVGIHGDTILEELSV